jgi:hypothetical protein
MKNSKRTCRCADGRIVFGKHRREVESRCHCFRSSYERKSLPQCLSEESEAAIERAQEDSGREPN